MKEKIKKAAIVIAAIGFVVIPLVLMLSFGKRNRMYKETEGYMEYLYFNWIDYPKKADKTDVFPEDVNREVFSWFGYDEEGTPLPESYYDIEFKYNGKFIFEDDYIAVPFEEAGQTYYRKIVLNNEKVVGVSDSLWSE